MKKDIQRKKAEIEDQILLVSEDDESCLMEDGQSNISLLLKDRTTHWVHDQKEDLLNFLNEKPQENFQK